MLRSIYLITSFIITISSIAVPIYLIGIKGILFTVLIYMLFILINLIVLLLNISTFEVGDLILVFFGFLTIRFKKIYHLELGHFWISRNGSTVNIYDQKLLHMVRIDDDVRYIDGDVEKLKQEIKKSIEEYYHEKEEKSKWKSWDGSIDKQSERDNKLNKLGI